MFKIVAKKILNKQKKHKNMSENIQQTYQERQSQQKWYQKFEPRTDVHAQEARDAIKRSNDSRQNYQTYRKQDK